MIAITATQAPKLIQKIGYRPIMIVAPLITAVGLYMLSHIPVKGDYYTDILPGLIVMAFGLGFSFVSVLVAATTGVAGHLSGLASGLVNTSQQIGGSLGLAILSGIAASATTRFIMNAHSLSQSTVVAATVHGYRTGFQIAVFFAIAASVLAILVIKQKAPVKPGSSEPIAI